MISWSFWSALMLTAVVLILLGVSRSPEIQHGDRILVDFCLGFVAVGASVFWLRALALVWG